MTTRTIQFLGQGYGAEPTTVTASWNGNTIYTGPVATVDQPQPGAGFVPAEIMFTHEIDLNLQGSIPMTVEINTGSLIIGPIFANYANISSRVDNVLVYSSSGPDGYRLINNAVNNGNPAISDVRENVVIDGVPQTPTRTEQQKGTWCYHLAEGSIISCQVDVDAGSV